MAKGEEPKKHLPLSRLAVLHYKTKTKQLGMNCDLLLDLAGALGGPYSDFQPVVWSMAAAADLVASSKHVIMENYSSGACNLVTLPLSRLPLTTLH